MKRFWLGAALMAALLVLGIFSSVCMAKLTQPIADGLSRATQASGKGDWAQAQRLTEEAKEAWDAHWGFLAAMNHHGPMEEIDSQFAQLAALLESRATAEFSACCAQLAEMLRALGEAHAVNLRNLL